MKCLPGSRGTGMPKTDPLPLPAEEAYKKIQEGRYLEGLALLAPINSGNPLQVDSRIETLRGQALESLGRLSEAEAAYWKALSTEKGGSSKPYLMLGLLKDRMEDREKGIWVLEEGLKLYPNDVDLLREAGILYGLTGQWHRALPYILEAYRRNPENPENIMAFGPVVDRLELVELYGEMHRAFTRLLEKNPGNPDIQDWYGRALERIEKSGQALKFFQKLLRKSPRDTRLLSHVARLSRNTNQTARALDTYRLLSEETGETVDILLSMAETQKMAGKPLSALSLIRQVLAIEPDNMEARLLLALALIDQGDFEKAEGALQDIHVAAAHYQLGELFFRKKHFIRAAGAFARGFALRPDPYYAANLLKLLLEENEDLLFLETLATLRILFPRTKVSVFLLKSAKEHFSPLMTNSSIPINNPDRLALAGLAEAFLPGGNRKRAYQLLEQAVTVDPMSEILFWTLAMFDEDAERWDSAVNWYKKVKRFSREPVTLLHRIAENQHNADSWMDPWPLLKEFSDIYGPRPGFFRVLFAVLARSGGEVPREILERGMKAFPEDPSFFTLYRSLEPERWTKLVQL